MLMEKGKRKEKNYEILVLNVFSMHGDLYFSEEKFCVCWTKFVGLTPVFKFIKKIVTHDILGVFLYPGGFRHRLRLQ